MNIDVFMVKQILVDDLDHDATGFLKELERSLGGEIRLRGANESVDTPYRFIYIASGGSENQFKTNFERLADRPCYLITRGAGNSLAAALEILTYIQQKNRCFAEILHGPVETIAAQIRALAAAYEAKEKLNGKKLGLIGASSDWLIASDADEAALKQKLGMSLVRIPMEELLSEIRRGGYPENEWTEALLKKDFPAAGGTDKARAEIEKALDIYGALKRLAERYELYGLTLRCFDLLGSVHSTGCLGLAILNAEGIYAGCEGDMTTLISMAIAGTLSGRPTFMANPARIDPASGRVTLAHCTLPLDMPESYTLDTHYESGIGVAVKGELPCETVTVFKTAGDLSKQTVLKGTLLENLSERDLCRTQIVLSLPETDCFLKHPIGNHHVILLGDHTAELREFFKLL